MLPFIPSVQKLQRGLENKEKYKTKALQFYKEDLATNSEHDQVLCSSSSRKLTELRSAAALAPGTAPLGPAMQGNTETEQLGQRGADSLHPMSPA
jgi:hypothetical protein